MFACTLRWLATGECYTEVCTDFGIARSTAQKWIPITIFALHRVLPRRYIKFPKGAELGRVMDDFESMCKLPQVAGAIDGTYIKMLSPPCEFSDRYWCYKGFHGILLLACVDAIGRFTYIDVGRPACVGDAAAWRFGPLQAKIESRQVLPRDRDRVVNGMVVQPYLLGDAAFPLSNYMIKGYDDPSTRPQQDFNYQVVRGRRVVECAFGRCKNRWRVLKGVNLYNPQFLTMVTSVCCALHNICETWKMNNRLGSVVAR